MSKLKKLIYCRDKALVLFDGSYFCFDHRTLNANGMMRKRIIENLPTKVKVEIINLESLIRTSNDETR